ncbi:MAG TPA: hypothetical protein VGO09_10885, partial [Flavisolibacter sp.]|nr:hypothetical protein [Flavisolibacter sp.]
MTPISLQTLTSSICPGKSLATYLEEKTQKTLNKIQSQADSLLAHSPAHSAPSRTWEFHWDIDTLKELNECFNKTFQPDILVKTKSDIKQNLNELFPVIFKNIEESSETIFEYTREKAQQGTCTGNSLWFAHLLFSVIQSKDNLEEQDLVRVANRFKFSSGKIPVLIQGLPHGERYEIMDIKEKSSQFQVPEFIKYENIIGLNSIPTGIYRYAIGCIFSGNKYEGHECMLIKLSDSLY